MVNLVGQLTKELLAPSETKSQRFFFTECSPPQPFTAQHVPEGKVKSCLGQLFQKVQNDENRVFAITSSKLVTN